MDKNNFKCIPDNPELLIEKPKSKTKKSIVSSRSLPKLSKGYPKSQTPSKTIKTLKTEVTISPSKSIASLQTDISELNYNFLPDTNNYSLGLVSK